MFSERTRFGKNKCENDAYNVLQSKTPAWDSLHAILGRLEAVLGRPGTLLDGLEALLKHSESGLAASLACRGDVLDGLLNPSTM